MRGIPLGPECLEPSERHASTHVLTLKSLTQGHADELTLGHSGRGSSFLELGIELGV